MADAVELWLVVVLVVEHGRVRLVVGRNHVDIDVEGERERSKGAKEGAERRVGEEEEERGWSETGGSA